MKWWWVLVLLAMPAAAAVAAGSQSAGVAVVRLTNTLTFVPRVVTVRPGQTVEWRNNSLLVHTVTADASLAAKAPDGTVPPGAKPFNSGNLAPGKVFRHTFKVPGRYHYFCIPHEGAGMVGEVVVQAGPHSDH